jgi:hypothetical protein
LRVGEIGVDPACAVLLAIGRIGIEGLKVLRRGRGCGKRKRGESTK